MNTTPSPAIEAVEQIQKALEGKWGFRPTPGPWFGSFDGVYEGEDRHSRTGRISSSCATRGKTEAEEANNVYIAACNPENIRAVLALLAAKQEELDKMREIAKDALDFMDNIDPDEAFNPPTATWAHALTLSLRAALSPIQGAAHE